MHEVQDLNAALAEMHTEVSRSRAEASELRRELEDTRRELSSLKKDVAAAYAPLSQSSAVTPSAPGPNLTANANEAVSANQVPNTNQAANASTGNQGLADRVTKLEEDQQLLGAKVDDQYQTKVESGSRYRVRLSGIALVNLFANRGRVDNQDVPNFAGGYAPLRSSGDFGGTVRQSLVGLEVFGPEWKGAKTSADVQFDFFGGFPSAWDGTTQGLVRMRTARVRLEWPRTSLMVGQDAPFFTPLSPTSMASVALPPLSYSGNLWTWTPQAHLDHRFALSENMDMLVQGGILDPLTGEYPVYSYYRAPDAGERAGQPAYATRIAFIDGHGTRPLTVGLGGYYARQDWGFGRNVDSWAGTADWSIPLDHWFTLTGEFYRGRAIGGLGATGGGSVVFSGPLLSPVTSVAGLNTLGGWGQLRFSPAEKIEFNAAYGQDQPFSSDLRRFPRLNRYNPGLVGRNQSAFVNVIYHARSNLLFSVEYRRLLTSQTSGTYDADADHVNVGVGVLF
jgi:hypothetical protein